MQNDYINRHMAIIEMMDNDVDHAQGTDSREVVQILMDMPAADVVEVIRCRYCKHWKPTMPSKGIVGICEDMDHFGRFWKPDDFCSYGKRKE